MDEKYAKAKLERESRGAIERIAKKRSAEKELTKAQSEQPPPYSEQDPCIESCIEVRAFPQGKSTTREAR